MHVLVTTASRHGSSAELAHAIAQQLTADAVTVHVRSPEGVVDVDGYDAGSRSGRRRSPRCCTLSSRELDRGMNESPSGPGGDRTHDQTVMSRLL